MRKKLYFLLVILLLVTSCHVNKSEKVMITLSEMCEMIKNDETFLVVLSQSGCYNCKLFHKDIENYLSHHDEIIYEVDLSEEDGTEVENINIIHQYFSDFATTPTMYSIVLGKTTNAFYYEESTMDENSISEWISSIQEK